MQAGKMMPDDGLEHLREQLYERVVQEVNRMPFFQKLHPRINQYREITGHLAQALEIAEGLHEGTIRVIRDAKSHVDEELQAATEMWNERLG